MIIAHEGNTAIHSPQTSPVISAQAEKSSEKIKNATTGLKESAGWSPERRAAQAARARAQKPWLRSTGPRSVAGKKACRMNGMKHGYRSEKMQALSRLLHMQKLFVARWRAGRYHPPRRRFPWLRGRGVITATAAARLIHQNRLGFLRYHTFSGES